MTKSAPKYQIPMLEKAFELIELLSKHPRGLAMQEIVNRLGLPKTTIFRLLNSLCDMGYLTKNLETNEYCLSRRLLRIGIAALGETNMVEQALPHMRKLRDDVREIVMLGVLMDNKVVLLEQVLGSHDFTFFLKPGRNFCLHASAPGKLYLAYMPDKEREKILESYEFTRYNEYTITDIESLRKELEKIRQQGYSTDIEEEMYGIHCVAAPIFDQLNQITATIWTSGPSGRLFKKDIPQVAGQVIEAAEKISINFGYIPSEKS